MKKHFFASAALALCLVAQPSFANDEFRNVIRIVGSSTVFPFAAYVAEQFHRKSGQKSPVVESTGSGGGIKMFCAGIGKTHPDIVNASRRMKVSEVKLCAENGVKSIAEIMIGYDGIALVQAEGQKPWRLTRHQLWLALAEKVVVNGQLVENPFQRWSEVDPSLPDEKIHVFGPPQTSGTRDVFVDLVMAKGCRGEEPIEKLGDEARKEVCGKIREDGLYIDAGEDDDLLVRKLANEPDAIGIIGYNVLERRAGIVQAAMIDSVVPTFENIYDGQYPLSRPLYLYVKNDHIDAVPGIKEYLAEFTSPAAIGGEGYLTDKGLIPLHDDKGQEITAQILQLTHD